MFRKTIITASLAAAAFVAISSASPAPASASGWDCFFEPAHCILEEVTPDRDRGPVEPTPDIDVEVPGFVTGEGPGILVIPQIPDDVLDAIMDAPGLGLPSIELPLPGEAPEAGVPDETPAAPAPAPAPTVPAPASETPAPDDTPGHGDHAGSVPVAERSTGDTPRPVPQGRAVGSVGTQNRTDTVENSSDDVRIVETGTSDSSQDEEATESLIDITTDVEAGTGIDPIMAALFGMLGALGLMAIVTAAFRAGRKNS